jgi:DNA polymerase-3 subunit gamma/tau
VRDSLSILDQAIAHSAGTVTAETVRDMLGLADKSRIVDLFEHLMKGDVAEALTEFRGQYDFGADPATVLTELAEFNHLVTRLRFIPAVADDPSLSEEERRRGRQFAETLSVRVLSRTWQMLLKGIQEVQASNRPLAAGEMVLIRIAHAAGLPTLDEALKSLGDGAPAGGASPVPGSGRPAGNGSGSSATVNARAMASPVRPSGGGGAVMRLVERAEPEPGAETTVAAPAPQIEESVAEPAVLVKSLADIANLADQHRDMAFKVAVKRCVRLVRLEPGRLEVSLTADAPKTLLSDMSDRLKRWTGRHWFVSISREEGGATLSEVENARRETALTDARADPAVAAILARFPGARIIDVRLSEEAAAEETPGPDTTEPGLDDDEDDDLL